MHMAVKAGQVQLLPINTHPAGSLPTPQTNRPDPCHTPFLSLPFPSPVQGVSFHKRDSYSPVFGQSWGPLFGLWLSWAGGCWLEC